MREVGMDDLPESEHSQLLTPDLWRNVCRKMPFWPKLRVKQIYWYKDKYIEGSLTMWSFSKVTTVHFHLWSWTFAQVCSMKYEVFSGEGLIKWLVTHIPHYYHATIALVGISCHAGQYCSMQGLVLDESIDVFSPPTVYIVCSIWISLNEILAFAALAWPTG